MKSYTDIEQSKKLAEILPIESADMCFNIHNNTPPLMIPYIRFNDFLNISSAPDFFIPCWGLAALFKLLPNCIEGAEPSLIKTFRDDYRIVYDIYGDEDITSEDHTNPIDACYEMILRFHEQKLL